MAYFTEINYGHTLSESEIQQITNYVQAQKDAGNTDGNLYDWQIASLEPVSTPGTQQVRMWSTLEAANGFISMVNSFTPPATSAKVF